ncbi:MAG: CHAT domain-containing protein, partial [Chloroflexota bacterium]
IQVTESVQQDLKVEEFKSTYTAQQVDVYLNLIDLLALEKRYEEAFNYAERSRARAALDQLGNKRIDIRKGASAEILKREQDTLNRLSALRQRLITLKNRPTDNWDKISIAQVEKDIATAESDYAKLLVELKAQSPEVAALVSIDVASITDIQKQLNANTMLVSYFVTEERVLAFVITQNKFETVDIPAKQSDVEKAIQDFRESFQANVPDPHPASLKQIHAWLVLPIKDKLKTPVVGVVPHGALHYLPFAALTDGTKYFGDEYLTFTLPSASALRFVKKKTGVGTPLVFGNPSSAEPNLATLKYAEQEANTISKFYGVVASTGKTATESELKNKASNAGIIHLAAHGQYNSVAPLFSTLYLAKDDKNDGRVEVHEIYGFDLTTKTDLVVLSACQTQLGKLSKGDEVTSLTRAFTFAGASTVISSLWSVDDQATGLLMERFYTHLRAGKGKGEALRLAQQEVRAKYPSPYYWAAFVLSGDVGDVTTITTQLTTPTAKGQPTPNSKLCASAAIPLGLLFVVAWRKHKQRNKFVTHH